MLWFSSCWSGVELRVVCPVCRMLQHPANRTLEKCTYISCSITFFLQKPFRFLDNVENIVEPGGPQ